MNILQQIRDVSFERGKSDLKDENQPAKKLLHLYSIYDENHYYVIGNLSEYEKYLKERGGERKYNQPFIIPEDIILITYGFSFQESAYPQIEQYNQRKRNIFMIQGYTDGTYGIFGNTYPYRNVLAKMGARMKTQLHLYGPAEFYTSYFVFPEDVYIQNDVEGLIEQINGNSFGHSFGQQSKQPLGQQSKQPLRKKYLYLL